MREIIIKAYPFDELSDAAKDKAVDKVRELLSGVWWDSPDTESVGEVILWTLAEQFGTPGYDDFGTGDFPGIPGVELSGWDLDRGQMVQLSGTLTPANAPSLPWEDDFECVAFEGRTYAHGVVRWDGDAPIPDDFNARERPMYNAIRAAFGSALRAGQDEVEHLTGEETAREWCENNDHQEYDADGDLL